MKNWFWPLLLCLSTMVACLPIEEPREPPPDFPKTDGGASARFATFRDVLYVANNKQVDLYRIAPDGSHAFLRSYGFSYEIWRVECIDSLLLVRTQHMTNVYDIRDPDRLVFTSYFGAGSEVLLKTDPWLFGTWHYPPEIGWGWLQVFRVVNQRISVAKTLVFTEPKGMARHDSLLLLCDKGLKLLLIDSALELPVVDSFSIDAQQLKMQEDVVMAWGKTGVAQYRLTPDLKLELLSRINFQQP